MYDVGYYWAVGELEEALRERRRIEKGKGREIIFSKIELDEQEVVVTGAQPLERTPTSFDNPVWSVAEDNGSGDACSSQAGAAGCGCSRPSTEPVPSTSCCRPTDPSTSSSCYQSTPSVPHPTSLPPSSSGEAHSTASLRSYTLPSDKSISDYLLFYIGDGDGLAIRNLLVTHSQNTVRFSIGLVSPF